MKNDDLINMNIKNLETELNKVEKEEQDKLYKLIYNYETLVIVNLKILKITIENGNNKPTIIYHLGLLIELLFKMILLKYDISDVVETGNLNHKISDMYHMITNSIVDPNIVEMCRNIMERALSIRYSNGKEIDYNEYTNFRYNHRKKSIDLIFNKELDENDKKYIKEVIECIELIMK